MSEVAKFLAEVGKLVREMKVLEQQVMLKSKQHDLAETEFFSLLVEPGTLDSAKVEEARLKTASLYETYLDASVQLALFAAEAGPNLDRLKQQITRGLG